MEAINEVSELEQLIEEGYQLVNKRDTRALEVLDKAIVLARQQASIRNYAFALLAKANYYNFVAHDTVQAINLCSEAKRWIDDNDQSLSAHYEASTGIAYHLMDKLELAQKNYVSAIKRIEKLEHKSKFDIEWLPVIYYNSYILFSYTESDEVFGNVEQLNRAIELYQQSGNKRGMMFCYNALANHYDGRSFPVEKSLEMVLKSCALEKEVTDPAVVAMSFSLAGLFLTKAGRNEEADIHFAKADNLLASIRNPLYEGMLLHNRGKALLFKKQFADALEYLQKAQEVYLKIDSKEYIKVWELLADSYAGAGDYHRAFEYERKFRTAKMEDATNQKLSAIASSKNELETEMKEREARLLREKNKEIENYARQLEFSKQKQVEMEQLKNEELKKEKDRSEGLLLNILPQEVADELKLRGDYKAKLFDDVTVLYTDFENFTIASERWTPQQLVDELHACFKAFDEITEKHNVEKIKTVGDAYLAASGVPVANVTHAVDMLKAAIEIRDFMINRQKELGDRTFGIRIGLHSGPVVAGIVGKKKFAYDIWGDTVNLAARMEQSSKAGKINISSDTYELVKNKFTCQYRGKIAAKNKGKVDMYFVESPIV